MVLRRVGRWPESMAIVSVEKEVKYKVPTFALKLQPRQEALLREHAQGHTKRHVDYMRQLMTMGISFKDSHIRAKQFIGR